jgi:hypothetical protein
MVKHDATCPTSSNERDAATRFTRRVKCAGESRYSGGPGAARSEVRLLSLFDRAFGSS